ncbi:MAG TPA: toll/interleukin-1 receptor domain-containing protein, partial [Bryobacteraceae bacterium]|nr:toll/interleukin-1 receptor domain-containing protein [Bryobacteraceae bacterium]
MKVFISWSGPRSNAAAKVLRQWLPHIMNAVEPWMSERDISSGRRWRREVEDQLATAKFGILCLTPDNLHSDWMLFEAGALAKSIEDTQVCPLLFGLNPTDLTDPLGQLQARTADKEDVGRLVNAINERLGEQRRQPEDLQIAFETFWPKMEEGFAALPTELPGKRPPRTDRQLLEEVLILSRAAAGSNQSERGGARSDLENGQ